eukprot:scaffold5150_cov133-Skeletonema_menzelii.AAC.1
MTMSQCNNHQHSSTGSSGGDVKKDDDTKIMANNNSTTIIPNPLLRHIHPSSSSAILHDLQTKGYHLLPSILTTEECSEAMAQLWEFVQDVSGGTVLQDDPRSWYSKEEITLLLDCHDGVDKSVVGQSLYKQEEDVMIEAAEEMKDDMDPWPYTGSNHHQAAQHNNNDNNMMMMMMQSLGAGYLLGNLREVLATRVFAPLFGTEELLCSKEGFTFCRPMIVDLEEYNNNNNNNDDMGDARYLVWNGRLNRKEVDDQLLQVDVDVGQQYDDQVTVPLPATKGRSSRSSSANDNDDDDDKAKATTAAATSKKQYNKLQKKLNKQQRYKDITGLCHIQAAVSLTDQTTDRDRNGAHFLCFPYSYSADHQDSNARGEKIYAKEGDVILWRSDLVDATVAPSLTRNVNNEIQKDHHDSNELFGYIGSREFGAVSYCSMLPVEAVKEYNLYSAPKHKIYKKMQQQCVAEVEKEVMQTKYKELTDQKLEAYRTGRTGDHRPEVENWHSHRR